MADMNSLCDLLKRNTALIHLVSIITRTTWGVLMASILWLHPALFLDLRHYTLSLLHGMWNTMFQILQCLHGQALRACLTHPKPTSTSGTISEVRSHHVVSYQAQESFRSHLKNYTRHAGHHLANICITRPSSSLARLVLQQDGRIAHSFTPAGIPFSFPWQYSVPKMFHDIPVIRK